MTAATRPTIKLWQVIVFGLLCVLVLGFLAVRWINNAQFYPVGVNPDGLSDVEVAAIEQSVEPIGGVQFFSADLALIHQEVSKLSWVESVKVYRDWQHGVMVSVVPRVAVANFGSEQMLDANGAVFTPADKKAVGNPKLIYVHGRPSESNEIMQQVRQINTWFTPLNMRVRDLILTPRKTWVIVFDNGIRTVVDHDNTEQKLYNLSVQLSSTLAKDLPKIQSVDLRYKNGFAIAYKHK